MYYHVTQAVYYHVIQAVYYHVIQACMYCVGRGMEEAFPYLESTLQ